MIVGGGKRTLTSEHDFAQQLLREREQAKLARRATTSKFFGASQSNTPSTAADSPTPSLPDPHPTIISLVEEAEDVVTQEAGYLSPTKSVVDLIDVSSPPSSREPSPDFSDGEDSYSSSDDADDVPSPQHARRVFVDNPTTQSVIYIQTPHPSYVSFPTPQSPSRMVSRTLSGPIDWPGSATTIINEPNIASIRSSQASSSPGIGSQSLLESHTTSFIRHATEDMYINSSPDGPSLDRTADVPTPLARFAYAPPRASSAEMAPTNDPVAGTTMSLNTPPRTVPSQTLPSWGPDLQDLFSPARSEVESVILGSDVPSPERYTRSKTPSPHDSDDEVDVFLTPQKESNISRGSDVEDVLDEEECDEPVFLGVRTASARKNSVEVKWREKWALAAPSFTKRKVSPIKHEQYDHDSDADSLPRTLDGSHLAAYRTTIEAIISVGSEGRWGDISFTTRT